MAPTAAKKKIAIMTSGGDSPGMNGVVRAVVRTALHMGCEPYCIYDGYEGLVVGGDQIKKAEWGDVRNYLGQGGTLIGTRRCMAFYERPGRLTAAKNMILNGIDALIICGGDGSLTGADKFRAEWPSLIEELVSSGQLKKEQVDPYRHLNIVGLVGSIDNDMSGTDATIGCYSALERICEMVDYIEATASSHSRAFVIEVMGRHCGWLALMAGVATGADFIFIPEKPREENWEEEMCDIVKRVRLEILAPAVAKTTLTGCSTEALESARLLSSLPRAPTTATARRSHPTWSRICSQTRTGLLWTPALQHSVTFSVAVLPLPTTECWLPSKVWRLLRPFWRLPPRPRPASSPSTKTKSAANR